MVTRERIQSIADEMDDVELAHELACVHALFRRHKRDAKVYAAMAEAAGPYGGRYRRWSELAREYAHGWARSARWYAAAARARGIA